MLKLLFASSKSIFRLKGSIFTNFKIITYVLFVIICTSVRYYDLTIVLIAVVNDNIMRFCKIHVRFELNMSSAH